jgi:hypothetical protein
MDLPSHPEANDGGADEKPAATGSRATTVVVAVLVALVVIVVILHLTGLVGPAAH